MQNYKELRVWEKAHLFTLKVYEVTKAFPKEEIYSLTNQLRRAALSVPANIALGSTNEAEYYLILAKDLKYLTEANFTEVTKNINEIKAMLILLIGKVRTDKKT
ncbi:MAG TPA: four helix bundle protein [Chitinophagaceae bacterium]|nr:four helix bundle protein [Chitinophagaceae bacterium]